MKAWPWAALALQLAAVWPVWRWYALRLVDNPDEALGLAGLAGAAWILFRDLRLGGSPAPGPGPLPVLATAVYAAAFPWLPPLARAALAAVSVACLLPALGLRARAAWQALGFLVLSLPAAASLQFYLGWPLRVSSGLVAEQLIRLAGYPATLEGTVLLWQDQAVLIDAPCSGVRMLWAGWLLAAFLGASRGCGPLGLMGWAAAATGAVFVGNVLRTAALFFLETGVVEGPAWAHGAAGVAAFLAAGAALLALDRYQLLPTRHLSVNPRPLEAA